MARKKITAKEFDEKFDNGEDVSEYIDFENARRINQPAQRVNVDFPAWVVTKLDEEATRIGVPRQALVKMWITERLDEKEEKRRAERREQPSPRS